MEGGCSSLRAVAPAQLPQIMAKNELKTVQSKLKITLKAGLQKVPLQGWLFIEKPSSLRIELFDRFGGLAWLLKTDGSRYFYYSVEENIVKRGEWASLTIPIPIKPKELIDLLLAEPVDTNDRYLFKTDRNRERIVVEKNDSEGNLQWIVNYLEFKREKEMLVPYKMEMEFPQDQLFLAISYQSYEINPILDQTLFAFSE